MALLYSSVPVSRGSVAVGQHKQYQVPETEAAKWNLAIIIVLFTPVLILWQVKMLIVKKAYRSNRSEGMCYSEQVKCCFPYVAHRVLCGFFRGVDSDDGDFNVVM